MQLLTTYQVQKYRFTFLNLSLKAFVIAIEVEMDDCTVLGRLHCEGGLCVVGLGYLMKPCDVHLGYCVALILSLSYSQM